MKFKTFKNIQDTQYIQEIQEIQDIQYKFTATSSGYSDIAIGTAKLFGINLTITYTIIQGITEF